MLKFTAREPNKVYLERFVIMATLLVPSICMQGFRALAVGVFGVLLCMAVDLICCLIRKIPYDPKDAAVPFWGLAMALMLPVSVPFALEAAAAVVCIAVGKHLFGASDNIVFCPPAIAAAFLIICYPSETLFFPKYGEKIPVFEEYGGVLTRSAEYSIKLGNVPSGSVWDILMGFVPGAVGTVYILVILVCGISMICHRSNSGCAVISCLITAGVLAFFFPRISVSGFESVFYELSSGYLLFGTVFLAAEPHRTPEKAAGRVIYGMVLGYITMMFRFFGQTEGSFLFALLITGALGSSFDRVVENVVYWKRTYVNSFEKSKTQVQRGDIKLTDTQEIVLPEKYRYNTPPIDGEVKKKRRRRREDKGDDNEKK
ncbi:MAG: RnfABCDGE type electron transport complex subunit D [Lachnospiraceae bacterium]|nr:RnfABCDGE type electron transport complex subunit D [Ruminococcus sp.]MCM1275220.1 RnfABCDGE type electron transport complex subunit D [Lachnospiraceae bacterium]